MFWLIIITMLLIAIPVTLFVQYQLISRSYRLDRAIYSLRALRYEATLYLSANLRNPALSRPEKEEYLKFIRFTSESLDCFDTLREKVFKFKTFKYLFLQIHSSSHGLEKMETGRDEKLIHFKSDFIQNLLLAFSAIPFFRARLLVRLSILIIKLFLRMGIRTLPSFALRLVHINQAYASLENQYGAICPC